jgi:N-acetyl-gamma-glutamyl-phosphate reductase
MNKNSQSDVATVRERVAVVGATGYAGQELVRLLARHPNATLTMATASQASSTPRSLPGLRRLWDGQVLPLEPAAVIDAADIIFLALPEAASAELGAAFLAAGRRVIDLSGAFRLKDDTARARWYPATTTMPDGVVYGLTEFTGAEIPGARLVSCPGCYPTASLLALQPLAEAGLLRDGGDVIIDAKSGVSGAGKAPSDRTHFCENHGSVAAYGLFGHRHTAEMIQFLGRDVTFTPHLVPLDRGILSTMYARLAHGVTAARVTETLEAAHARSPFVRLTGDTLPEIKHVAYTNFCDIGWRVDEATGRIILVSVIDNLLKGAAGQGVQNFNVLVGLDETTGLY